MSEPVSGVAERAAELRREFDRTFAEPIRLDTVAQEDLLGARVGEQRYAIRLSEIAGLHAGKTITRVPGSNAALCGIAGFRGALLPVYDLHVLLGHSGGQTPRWLLIAAAAPIALAFATFEKQLRVSRDEIVPQAARTGMPSYAREIVRTQSFIGPILHLPSVLEAIKTSTMEAARAKE